MVIREDLCYSLAKSFFVIREELCHSLATNPLYVVLQRIPRIDTNVCRLMFVKICAIRWL